MIHYFLPKKPLFPLFFFFLSFYFHRFLSSLSLFDRSLRISLADKDVNETSAKLVEVTITPTPVSTSSNIGTTSSSSSSSSSSSAPGEEDTVGTPMEGEDDGDAAELMDDADVEVGGTGATKRSSYDGDLREHLNVIHIGHVDSGKSTLSGSILFQTGQIDQRTIEKFEREAKQRGRDSWWLAYILDTTEEERSKGITVEVGRATFETPNKRFTILDAPGHKSFVANMIQGAAQADIAVLVISARKGEFETGFEKGGQTREHALLAKTLGVRVLIVVVNKMDEPTVQWSKERYDECTGKIIPFLKSSGYNSKHVHFLPIAALSGANIKDRLDKKVCPWYDGPALLELLDSISVGGRDADGPLRIPILDKYIDRGIITMGKVESGTVREGQEILVMPQGVKARIDKVYINDGEVAVARPGENVKVKIRGCLEDDIQRGFVLCTKDSPVVATTQFEAQLMLLELDHKNLFTAGYSAVLHLHTAEEEVVVAKLVAELDKKTGEPKPGGPPRFVKSGALCVCVLKTVRTVCVEKFENMQQLGRFTLRDEGRTIGIGKVLRLGIPKAATGSKGSSSSTTTANTSSSSSSNV